MNRPVSFLHASESQRRTARTSVLGEVVVSCHAIKGKVIHAKPWINEKTPSTPGKILRRSLEHDCEFQNLHLLKKADRNFFAESFPSFDGNSLSVVIYSFRFWMFFYDWKKAFYDRIDIRSFLKNSVNHRKRKRSWLLWALRRRWFDVQNYQFGQRRKRAPLLLNNDTFQNHNLNNQIQSQRCSPLSFRRFEMATRKVKWTVAFHDRFFASQQLLPKTKDVLTAGLTRLSQVATGKQKKVNRIWQ